MADPIWFEIAEAKVNTLLTANAVVRHPIFTEKLAEKVHIEAYLLSLRTSLQDALDFSATNEEVIFT